MSSLALINELIGLPPNASEHGYQIDHIIEFSHWFMAFLFAGWSIFLIYVLIRFHKSRHPVADHEGVKSGISTHLEFAVVLIDARSEPMPGENVTFDNGVYMNQPKEAVPLGVKKPLTAIRPPNRYSQYESMLSRGNATSGAPICSGRM